MERVSPIEMGSVFDSGKLSGLHGSSVAATQEGRIEKSLGSGLFLAVLGDGREIKVRGSAVLKAGDSVEVID